ncbi:hypothetical protein BgiMline_016988 [Biomphalaria glabrata]|nr:hypothetical protein BgiMline_009741 [Biomphalaria glabrata]
MASIPQFAVVTTFGKYVNILEKNTKHTVVVEAPYVVKTAALSTHQGATFACLTTLDDKLWTVSLVQAPKQISDSVCCEDEEDFMDSDDIFDELLDPNNDGETCHQEWLPLHSDPNVTKITVKADDLLYRSDLPILDVALWNNLVAIIHEDSDKSILRVFRIEEQEISHKMKRLLKVMQNIDLGVNANLFKGEARQKRLYFVLQQEKFSGSQNYSPSLVHLPKVMFISLFGREASVFNSPVLLVCLNSGKVMSHVIGHNKHQSSSPRLPVICQLNSDIVTVCQVFVKWPEEQNGQTQDIISALSSALQAKNPRLNKDSEKEAGTEVGFLIISVTGECCLIVSQGQETSSPSVLLFSLPSEVQSCIVQGRQLVYSTQNSVEVCELKLRQVPGHCQLSVVPENKTLLRKVKISNLVSCLSDGHKNEDDTVVAVTNDLKVLEISIRSEEPNISLEASSLSFSDILHNIGQCTEKIKEIKTKSSSLDSFLVQMNILASLKQGHEDLCSKQQTRQAEPIISCSCDIVSTTDGYSRQWALNIGLLNQSSVALSSDWSLTVLVCSLDPVKHQQEHISKVHTFSLSKGLPSKSRLEFHVPVNTFVLGKTCPKLLVTLSLVLHFKNLNFLPDSFKNQCQKGICAFLTSKTLDILNFVYQLPPGDTSQATGNINEGCVYKCVNQLAEARVKGSVSSFATVSCSLSTTVGIPAAAAWKFASSCDVLELLLPLLDKGLFTNSSCQLQMPSGALLAISVGNTTQDPDLVRLSHDLKYFVTIRSSDVVLLSEMRDAVKNKLEINHKLGDKLETRSRVELQQILDRAEIVKEFLCQCQGLMNSSNENVSKIACDMLNKFESVECLI